MVRPEWLRSTSRLVEQIEMLTEDTSHFVIENMTLQEVEKLVNLGCVVRNDGGIRDDVAIETMKGRCTFQKHGIRLCVQRGKLVSSTVLSVLLQGSKMWKGLGEIERVFKKKRIYIYIY